MGLFKKKYGLSDEELLGMLATNPNGVIEEIYKRYSVLTFGLALKYLQDRDMAKDAVSEIFLKLRTDLSKHDIKNFKGWLYVFSRNYCLEQIRIENRRQRHEELWGARPNNVEYDPEIDIQISRLKGIIPKLKSGQKECIQKFYLERKSYVEISETLSISIKQVKSNLQNGKRNLQILMGIQRSNNHQS